MRANILKKDFKQRTILAFSQVYVNNYRMFLCKRVCHTCSLPLSFIR